MFGETQKSEKIIKEKNALVFIYDNYRCCRCFQDSRWFLKLQPKVIENFSFSKVEVQHYLKLCLSLWNFTMLYFDP